MKPTSAENLNPEDVFDKYLAMQVLFARDLKITKPDIVLYSIYKGVNTPSLLIAGLSVAKGNLANYCKTLISDKLLVRCCHGSQKNIYYELTAKGQDKVNKMLNRINKLTVEH